MMNKSFRLCLVMMMAALHSCGPSRLEVSDLVAKADPAVVLINSYDENNKPFSLGSGFVISEDGLIVTNYHVIKRAVRVEVKLPDNRKFDVTGLVAYQPSIDYAILKINASGLASVPMGDDTQLKIGDELVAIGNPQGLEHTVTKGILSQRRKDNVAEYLQTDASINPGNSGGPLFNMFGEAIGVNTLKARDAEGIGFAIPISYIKKTLQKGTTPQISLKQVYTKQLQEDEAAFASLFVNFKHPENLFSINIPKEWFFWKKDYWLNDNTELHKELILAPQGGYDGESYLSQGVRLTFFYPQEGNVWTMTSAEEWGPFWQQSLLKNNPGFAMTNDSTVTYLKNGQAVKVYHAIGKNEKIQEPEMDRFVVTANEKYRLVIELVAPLSKFNDNRDVFEYVIQSFRLENGVEHPAYPQ
ncbi:MAG: trypsin-like peptidase domain-containing protein [Spirosomataceae bacterium]